MLYVFLAVKTNKTLSLVYIVYPLTLGVSGECDVSCYSQSGHSDAGQRRGQVGGPLPSVESRVVHRTVEDEGRVVTHESCRGSKS